MMQPLGLRMRTQSTSLQSAALFVRRTGLSVRVIIPRGPSVVALAREIAAEAGLEIEVSLGACLVSVSYEVDSVLR